MRVCTQGVSLHARATEGCCGIGRASNVCRASARTNLVDEISVLCLLTQLEVSSEQLSVFVSDLVTEFLHSCCIDKCASCFAFCVDSRGDVIAHTVNVAVCAADSILDSIEAIFHTRVNSIEAVRETIGDATQLSVYILVVEAFEEVRTSECALYCGVATAIASEQSTTAENCEPYKVDEPFVTG